jgi:hypothetical protein
VALRAARTLDYMDVTSLRRWDRLTHNGTIVLHVPAAVIKAKSASYLSRGKPARRNPMINEDDYSIVGRLGPRTGASPSTACSSATCFGFTGCAGS